MARVALVTGRHARYRRAISKALHAAHYDVAANYASNDEAAAVFLRETGIRTFKWDVSNFDACSAGVRRLKPNSVPLIFW
jgi:acetoacetyl-CoA reductase